MHKFTFQMRTSVLKELEKTLVIEELEIVKEGKQRPVFGWGKKGDIRPQKKPR